MKPTQKRVDYSCWTLYEWAHFFTATSLLLSQIRGESKYHLHQRPRCQLLYMQSSSTGSCLSQIQWTLLLCKIICIRSINHSSYPHARHKLNCMDKQAILLQPPWQSKRVNQSCFSEACWFTVYLQYHSTKASEVILQLKPKWISWQMSNMCLFNVDSLLRNTDQLHSSSSPAGQHSIRRYSKQPPQEWLFEAKYMQLTFFSLSGYNNANQIHQKLYKKVSKVRLKCII